MNYHNFFLIEAIVFNTTSGINVEIEPPVKAPSKLANTSADEEPKNTARGFLEVPLMVKVANCVLSPSSAMKTVKNVDNNRLNIIYKYILRMSKAKMRLTIVIKRPVKNANLLGDIFEESHLPINTPTILELIKAKELPRKTIIGSPDSADNIKVAI